MKNRWISFLIYLLAGLVLIALIVGVPLLINLSYQLDTVIYITEWRAADVLSYYGTVISTLIEAAVTVLTIVFTISFNRKQIQRETYLKAEQEKYGKIESLIAQALERINPKRILLVSTDVLSRFCWNICCYLLF